MSNEPGCPERSPAHSRGSHGTTPATPSTGLLHPDWLSCLFSLSMFHPCPRHPGVKRNECNFFCARCSPREGQAYCRMCLDSHGDCPGPVFQIRKYMYQTCVHVEDIAPLHDVTGIQAYLINSKRALLIHSKISALASANSALDEICRCPLCLVLLGLPGLGRHEIGSRRMGCPLHPPLSRAGCRLCDCSCPDQAGGP